MATDQRRRRGELGERIAEEHLAHRGYAIVARNFRTRYGELDLIAADEHALVFCEVKTRVAGSRGGPDGPLDAIGPRKRERLRRMAGQWLAENPATSRPRAEELRFDAIGVMLTPAGRLLALEHLENAF
ncbi:MAG: putative endonuclease [Thermoleophilaceae bacterium]|jgi:putative endonuclease|nr:putative endonuclease [Thermoleophilaceae bacterium]